MSQAAAERVAAVVVTYNRRTDLEVCLDRLAAQTRPLDAVLVVDNASSDGTRDLLAARGEVTVLALPDNRGGAGGFAAGVAAAVEAGHDWLWLMDDDCVPERDALERLLERARGAGDAGGILPVVQLSDGRRLAGAVRGHGDTGNPVGEDGRPAFDEVDLGPFVGPLLRAEACRAVGNPREEFFIWHDDVEYLLRLRLAGWRLLVAPGAVVHHPFEPTITRRVLGRERAVRDVSPWKEYYDARNRLVVDRVTRGTPLGDTRGAVERASAELGMWVAVAVVAPRGWQRVAMRAAGLLDAARGRLGPRVRPGQAVPWRR